MDHTHIHLQLQRRNLVERLKNWNRDEILTLTDALRENAKQIAQATSLQWPLGRMSGNNGNNSPSVGTGGPFRRRTKP